jgi:hypothetical protein
MPVRGICRVARSKGWQTVPWPSADPAYSQPFEEGEELVWWLVATDRRVGRRCPGEGALFDREVAV